MTAEIPALSGRDGGSAKLLAVGKWLLDASSVAN
jgi:hypothetical protein